MVARNHPNNKVQRGGTYMKNEYTVAHTAIDEATVA